MQNLVPIQISKCTLSKVGAEFEESLTLGEWLNIGEQLRAVESCHLFLLGDWINFGATKYGEKYKQALKISGYDEGYLRNVVHTCASVEMSRRRDKLKFGHHFEVAKFSGTDQSWWLEKAESENWSVMDLRQAIRKKNQTEDRATPGESVRSFAGIVTEAQRWIAQLEKERPLDTWAPVERANTKAQLEPLVEFYGRL
jgi:hypothetical protein